MTPDNLNNENADDCAGVDVHHIVLYKAHTFYRYSATPHV